MGQIKLKGPKIKYYTQKKSIVDSIQKNILLNQRNFDWFNPRIILL